VTDLNAAILKAKNDSQAFTTTAEGRLNATITAVKDSISTNAAKGDEAVKAVRNDSKSYTEECTKALNAQIVAMFPPVEDRITTTEKSLSAAIQQVDAGLRVALGNEIQSLCDKFAEELQGVRDDIENQLEMVSDQITETIETQRKEVDDSIEALRKEASTRDATNFEQLNGRFAQVLADQLNTDTLQDEKSTRAQNEIYVKIGKLQDMLNEFKAGAASDSGKVALEAAKQLQEYGEGADRRLDHLEDEARRMRGAMSEVENVPTRRVEWVIQKASKCLRPADPSKSSLHTSWFSPKFDAAGGHGLQIELQRFKATEPPVDGQEAGDLAVYLWACKGTSMVFRLFIGDKVTPAFEKNFNGRVPYGTGRLCFLRDQINKEDDTLKIGLEVLELVREVEHVLKASPDAAMPEASPVSETPASKVLDASMFFRRTTNFRVAEQVEHQIELMKSRMIRKIEWRLEHASILKRSFPKGHAICSLPFNAAGVDGLQLVFYPSGYSGASDGFCSFFLYGPAGATLKCWLWAGSKKRETSHSFDEPGAFGRTNFCLYDGIIDEVADTVTLMLEIEDAEQDIRAATAHPVVECGDRRTEDEIQGKSPQAIESIVKLTRKPGEGVKTAANSAKFEDIKVLPSLWTSIGVSDKEKIPEGAHTFEEVKSGRTRPNAGQRTPSGALGGSGKMNLTSPSAMRRHESAPTLHEVATGLTAMQEDLFSPSAQVASSRSHGNDRDRPLSGMGKSGGEKRARRIRPSSGGTQSIPAKFTT